MTLCLWRPPYSHSIFQTEVWDHPTHSALTLAKQGLSLRLVTVRNQRANSWPKYFLSVVLTVGDQLVNMNPLASVSFTALPPSATALNLPRVYFHRTVTSFLNGPAIKVFDVAESKPTDQLLPHFSQKKKTTWKKIEIGGGRILSSEKKTELWHQPNTQEYSSQSRDIFMNVNLQPGGTIQVK